MKKVFFLPLFAAAVAVGGALASNAAGTQAMAYGKNTLGQCVAGTLINPTECSDQRTDAQCEVSIPGHPLPVLAWSNNGCTNEIFKQPN